MKSKPIERASNRYTDVREADISFSTEMRSENPANAIPAKVNDRPWRVVVCCLVFLFWEATESMYSGYDINIIPVSKAKADPITIIGLFDINLKQLAYNDSTEIFENQKTSPS